ncbi:MAG: hypothetical protein FWD69_04595 [Polyangiaceae bacterium]|nr:hypothetical protein [Polyangiaceae bacterium]
MARTHRGSFRRFVIGLVCAAASFFAATSASAQTKVGVDVQADAPISPSGVSGGIGGSLRLGYELNAIVATLTPELGGGYHAFGGVLSPNIMRGFVGGRVGVGAPVRTSVFAHFGYARVINDNAPNRNAPTFDAGLAFDLLVIPRIDLGIHGAYNVVSGNDQGSANKWLSAGLHVQIAF